MTFYVRVKEEVPEVPNPKFVPEETYLLYSGKKAYANETLEVPEGATVWAYCGVKNEGGRGDVQCWAYDKKSGEYIGSSSIVTMDEGEKRTIYIELKNVPADGWDVELQACYIQDGTPYINDRLGCIVNKPGFPGAIEL